MENYSVSLSELSKLYNIDKSVLKKIIKKISKKTKKKKAKAKSKVKSQSIKFSNKKPQDNNEITYSYGKQSQPPNQSQLQTVSKSSGIDPRDIGIFTDKIKDLSLQNKLLITDVVPNLVNTSQTHSTDLFNQMNTRVDKLSEAARLRFNFLSDNVGDWNDKRKFTNPNLKEEQDQITNRLSNIPTTYNIRVGEIVDENQAFYNDQPDDTFQIPPVQEDEKQDVQEEEIVQSVKVPPVVEDEKQDVQEEEDVEEEVKPKQKKDYEYDPPPGFTIPKQKKTEDIRQHGYRVQYYIKKFNNEPVSKSSEKKYRTGYLQYLKQLNL